MNSSVAFWPSAACRARRGGPHAQAVLGGQRAAGLELRHPLDLDQAHAARADSRPEAGLVAEDRDLDPGGGGGLDQAGALRHGHRAAVDSEADELGALTPARSTVGWCVCWSTGRDTPSSDDSPPKRAAAVVDVRLELVAELRRRSSRSASRPRRRAGRGTCRGCGRRRRAAGRARDCSASPVLDLVQQLHHPARALAARRALPARLVHVELRDAQAELHHAAAVVDHDHPAEPIIEPAAASESWSSGVSIWSAVSTGTDEPPGITALSLRPPGTPPPRS